MLESVIEVFPAPTPVTAVTPLRLIAYQQKRLGEKAAPQTLGNELSALRRGFSLAVDKELLARAPKISIPKADNIREGFFEDDDFAAVLLDLPPYGQAPIRFCRLTGWRIEEVLTLTWERVDWEHQGIRLSPCQTKGKKARLFPFGMAPELKALLESAWNVRHGPFVFQGPRKGNAWVTRRCCITGSGRQNARGVRIGLSTICAARPSGISCRPE